MTTSESYMLRALQLARQGEGRTAPNPPVGAVLVADGVVVGEGFHPVAGQSHAEIFALRAAGKEASGSDLYVTLEPCCHHGRTGPCTEAIISAGVRRVIYGVVDPNPRVAGQGLAQLRAAGIEVIAGPLAEECRQLLAPFAKAIHSRLPFVTFKAAMSLDGQTATSQGESQWISGVESRELVHHLRNRVDGILVGSGTVIADDPQLTVRLPDVGRNPARIVIDGRLRTSPSARVYSPGQPGRRLLLTGDDIPVDRLAPFIDLGVEVVAVPHDNMYLNLVAAMTEICDRGLHNLLLESGGDLSGAMLRAGLVDRLMLFVAPVLFGGGDGRPLFSGAGTVSLAKAIALTGLRARQVGCDVLLEGEVVRCSPD